jgi:hypothetical protein
MKPPMPPRETPLNLQVLLTPPGQLSGDGQLRELMLERRRHLNSASGDLWVLPGGREGQEALAIADPAVATWLQLRFGGVLQPARLDRSWLDQMALELPAAAGAPALGVDPRA